MIIDNSEGDGKRRDKTESTNGDCHQEIKVTGSRCFDIFNSIKRIILFKMGCCGCGDDDTAKIEPGSPERESSFSEVQVFAKNRSCTDLPALLILLLIIAGYGYFVSAAVKKGDPFRLWNGYDDCANVCGRITSRESNPEFSCKGADLRKFGYHYAEFGIDGVKSRKCIESCDNLGNETIRFLNRCIVKSSGNNPANALINNLGVKNFFNEAANDLNIAWRELIYLLLIALASSLCILIAFRYIVQYVIFIVLSGAVVISIAGTIYLWLLWHFERKDVMSGKIDEEEGHVRAYLVYAILMSIVAVVTLLVVLVMRRRIALVSQLFKETGKAIYSMPGLLLQPIYTYIIISASLIGWLYVMLWIESAGDLYKNKKGHFHYKKNGLLEGARWYNIFMYFIMMQFYLGCQHMIVAGAVARWFFTRDKKHLSMPVTRSTCSLIRHHLGTVAFGSLIIGFVSFLRAIFAYTAKYLQKYDNAWMRALLCCCHCCLWCLENVLKFLTRNAYIETAIYGCNLCAGGKKAFRALTDNILRVAAINSVGDFVLFLGKVLVVALTVVAGVYLIQRKDGLRHPWVPIALGGLFALLIAHCFISIYEMIIDTIFICFCEDCSRNDGISRPYYMSRGLMEFVENSKEALKKL
ncbi:choline transporter-like protein 1 isoform X1 [Microplitis demolitor]|uniref:choline transporter-like protein 1 isoform X1 n=2 Tax=Microplitis demolitor TaxID=69319 RepID=UPI00235B6359|nr:choline transporter-like protein 1 isoform X1 [Microplitis demolitor]